MLAMAAGRLQQPSRLFEADYIPSLKPNSSAPGESVLGGWSGWAAQLWRQAAQEENLTVHSVSYWGRQAAKFPRSWVEKIRSLDHKKRYNFSFIGSSSARNRIWVRSFAREKFTDKDYFEYHNVNLSTWKRLGPFDHTGMENHQAKTLQEAPRVKGRIETIPLDTYYWQILASSNFSLCPRGDQPYAMHFYDAMLAGSIPVIRRVSKDLDSPFWIQTSVPYNFYAWQDTHLPLQYRQDWVDENMRLFIKYQTFIEGDNTPPGWVPPPGMKEMIDISEGAR